jgi:hypothetical protein
VGWYRASLGRIIRKISAPVSHQILVAHCIVIKILAINNYFFLSLWSVTVILEMHMHSFAITIVSNVYVKTTVSCFT